MKKMPEVGQKIYVHSSYYISHGSDDFVGGLATISAVKEGISAGKPCPFVSIEERPGVEYNWEFLEEEQEELKKQFGEEKSHSQPDIDTPWLEKGDILNGEIYDGPDVW